MASRIPSTSPVFPSFPKLYVVPRGDWVGHHMGEERNESSIKKTAPKSSSADLTLYLTESWMSDRGILLWKTQVQRLFTLSPGDSKCQMNIDTCKAVGCTCDRHVMRHCSHLCAVVQISCVLFDLDSAIQLLSLPSAAVCECSGSTWIRSALLVRGSQQIVLLCAPSIPGSSRGAEGCSVFFLERAEDAWACIFLFQALGSSSAEGLWQQVSSIHNTSKVTNTSRGTEGHLNSTGRNTDCPLRRS